MIWEVHTIGRVVQFVGKVLGGIRGVFLPCWPQFLSCLNLGYKSNFETHKSSIQEREFYGEILDVIHYIPKTFVGEAISYWMGYFCRVEKSKLKRGILL